MYNKLGDLGHLRLVNYHDAVSLLVEARRKKTEQNINPNNKKQLNPTPNNTKYNLIFTNQTGKEGQDKEKG